MKNFFCKYSTGSTVLINNKCLAILFRILQLLVAALIIFIISFGATWNKMERGISNVYTNVEGVDNLTGGTVYDAVDFVRPSREKDAFFIATKIVITKQEQGICTDHHEDGKNSCSSDNGCQKEKKGRNGINTGKCNEMKGMCEIKGWCPVQYSNSSRTTTSQLESVDKFTVYIKNVVRFSSFKSNYFVPFCNHPKSISEFNYNFMKVPTPCLYDPVKSPWCPIFSIKNILNGLNVTYDSVKKEGTLIGLFINWTCYFNKNSSCKIIYRFERFAQDTLGKYKYKFAEYHEVNGKDVRTMITAYGLRFIVIVDAKGYQFDWYTFVENIGSFLSYFTTLGTIVYFSYASCCFTEKQKESHIHEEDYLVQIKLHTFTSKPNNVSIVKDTSKSNNPDTVEDTSKSNNLDAVEDTSEPNNLDTVEDVSKPNNPDTAEDVSKPNNPDTAEDTV